MSDDEIEELRALAAAARDLASKWATECEYMQMRITALEKAVTKAGITIPPTRHELLQQARRL